MTTPEKRTADKLLRRINAAKDANRLRYAIDNYNSFLAAAAIRAGIENAKAQLELTRQSLKRQPRLLTATEIRKR
jgi:hypothetical protein